MFCPRSRKKKKKKHKKKDKKGKKDKKRGHGGMWIVHWPSQEPKLEVPTIYNKAYIRPM